MHNRLDTQSGNRPAGSGRHTTILVFDSGLGGLTVYREIAVARPDANYIYVADDAGFPYGAWEPQALSARVVEVVGALLKSHRPDLAVIACNTASTLALADLRRNFAVPFVGTVPAIKPACSQSATKLVSVLGTEVTVAREYTRALIREFAQGCAVTLVGSKRLAVLAESQLRGEPPDDNSIQDEIAPCFVEAKGRRTDKIVLACTHYPLLLHRMQRLAPWPVNFVDPAPAIARRVVALLGLRDDDGPVGKTRFHFTSGRPVSDRLSAALAGFAVQGPAARREISPAPR